MTSQPPENKPKWKRLNSFCCPKCNEALTTDQNGLFYQCPDKLMCGFKISEKAFDRVVKQIQRGFDRQVRLGDDTKALEYLNNYGHNKQSADFSGDETLAEGY